MSHDSGHDEDLLDFDGDDNDTSIELKDQDLLDDDERTALENVIAASANPNKSGMDISSNASTSKNGIGDEKGDGDGEMPTDLDGIKKRMKEMEDEAEKLRQMQSEMESQLNQSGSGNITQTPEQKQEADSRSIYVGNVDYGTTAEELEAHFNGCGPITRVTILCDKFSSHPKGFAYIEFADKDSVETAMVLDESLFRGRQIKVVPKRTNVPGISTTNRAPWRRGRGRGRASFRGYRGFRGRPRRRSWYSPY